MLSKRLEAIGNCATIIVSVLLKMGVELSGAAVDVLMRQL